MIRFSGLSAQAKQIDEPQESLVLGKVAHDLSKDVGGKSWQDGWSSYQTTDLEAIKLGGEKAVVSTGTHGLTPALGSRIT